MKPFHLLLVMSVVLLCGPTLSAQGDKSEQNQDANEKFRGRGDLLAKSLIFSKEFTWITDLKTAEGLPDYPAAINNHFGKGVTPEQNGAVALYEAFGAAPEGTRLSDRFFELLGVPVPPDDGEYFQSFGIDLPIDERPTRNIVMPGSSPGRKKTFPSLPSGLRTTKSGLA